jgi:hypothetical protein
MAGPMARTAGSGRANTCVPIKWLASWISERGAMTSISLDAHALPALSSPDR